MANTAHQLSFYCSSLFYNRGLSAVASCPLRSDTFDWLYMGCWRGCRSSLVLSSTCSLCGPHFPPYIIFRALKLIADGLEPSPWLRRNSTASLENSNLTILTVSGNYGIPISHLGTSKLNISSKRQHD